MNPQLFDIRSYLENKGIRVTGAGKNVSSGWIGVRCLWCSDHSNHLGINLKTKKFKCWKCHRKGIATQIVMELEHCGLTTAESIMSQWLDLSVPNLQKELSKSKAQRLELPKEFTKEFPDIHYQYLLKRGFIPEVIIKKYDLMACYNLGKYKFRIVVPIVMDYTMVGFTTRDVTEKAELRYRAISDSDALKPSREWVYNIDSITGSRVLITEGPFDVWRMGDESVCFLGTEESDSQVLELKRRDIKWAGLLYDSEEEAQEIAEKICFNLESLGISSEIFSLPEGDPAELSNEEAEQVKREILG